MNKKYTMKYKSCKYTPCGSCLSTHNNCKPKYCAKKEVNINLLVKIGVYVI